MSADSIHLDALPRALLLFAIRFYRRRLSGRGPFARASCTFGALESCAAFGERVAIQSPSTLTAIGRMARRLRRCRHLSLYRLRDGELGWGRHYDRVVASSPLESIRELERRLRRDGETRRVCEAVGGAARRVALECGCLPGDHPGVSVRSPLPQRDAPAARGAWRRRRAARLTVASSGALTAAWLAAAGVTGFAAMTVSLGIALLAGLAALAAGRELKRLEALEVLARLEVPTDRERRRPGGKG